MIPNLPRPFLWTEIETLDKFFLEEPVTLGLYHIITESLSELDEKIDAIKLFNEMFYQLTRIYYEESTYVDYPEYVNDIKANLGWSFSADLVMTMIYTYFRIKDKDCPPSAAMLLGYIKMNQSFKPFWKKFRYLRSSVAGYSRSNIDPKKPHPLPARKLQGIYIDFNKITNGYKFDRIKEILNLWQNNDDKKIIARKLYRDVKMFTKPTYVNRLEILQYLRSFFPEEIIHHNIMVREELNINSYELPPQNNDEDELEQLREEKRTLQGRIEELDKEIERLNTLLAKQENNKGKNRKFTLVQIADYSKNCVEWNDVKYIVAMLNKLIRDDANKEENEIVDSIEEEFKKRIGGSTFNEKVGQVIQHADKVIM